MSHQLVDELQEKAISVSQACGVLQVSRSGYYSATRRAQVAPAVCVNSIQVKAAFAASGRTYGSPRVCAALRTQGITMGRHRVRSLMRTNGLRCVWQRCWTCTREK